MAVAIEAVDGGDVAAHLDGPANDRVVIPDKRHRQSEVQSGLVGSRNPLDDDCYTLTQ